MEIWKRPDDKMLRSLDFTPLVGTLPITLVSCTSENLLTGADSTSAIIATSPAPAVAGQAVVLALINGAVGERHRIDILVSTADGQKWPGTIWLDVREGE
jgi:hypothetical protein